MWTPGVENWLLTYDLSHGSPATMRPVMAKLTSITGGRCFGLRYRLAPQHAFPSALLDLLVAYLSLLYPPEGAYHLPVSPTSIVLTGDSSGANLCFSLLQVILELGRQQSTSTPTVRFGGRDVLLPCPAGLASICGFLDLARALPSWTDERDYDILNAGMPPMLQPDFPTDDVWPTVPPRGDLYCDNEALCHPLVSPVAARDWTGAPPMLIVCGEERGMDSNKLLAQRATAQGICVQWQQYEALPHVFMLMMPKLPHSALCFKTWAKFCLDCVKEPDLVQSHASVVGVKSLNGRTVDPTRLTSLTLDEALRLMNTKRHERRVWTGLGKPRSPL